MIAACIADKKNQRVLAEELFGPAAILCVGLAFLGGFLGNITEYGEFWMIGAGRVSREERPALYWTVMGLLLLLPAGLIVFAAVALFL